MTEKQWNKMSPKKQMAYREKLRIAGEMEMKAIREQEEWDRIKVMNPVSKTIYMLKRLWQNK